MHDIASRLSQHPTHNSSAALLTGMRMYVYALPLTYALSIADGRLTISLLLSGWLATLLTFRLIRHNLVIPTLSAAFLLFFAFFFY